MNLQEARCSSTPTMLRQPKAIECPRTPTMPRTQTIFHLLNISEESEGSHSKCDPGPCAKKKDLIYATAGTPAPDRSRNIRPIEQHQEQHHICAANSTLLSPNSLVQASKFLRNCLSSGRRCHMRRLHQPIRHLCRGTMPSPATLQITTR